MYFVRLGEEIEQVDCLYGRLIHAQGKGQDEENWGSNENPARVYK